MTDIEWMEKRVYDLRAQLRDAEEELLNARYDASPVKLGDIVINKKDRAEYRVCCVKFFLGAPWIKGNPRKKDGSFGVAVRFIGDAYELKSE